MKGGAEAPDAGSVTTVKEYNYVAGQQAARREGHVGLHAARRQHGAHGAQRVGRLGAGHPREQRLQAGQGLEDGRRQDVQARARADRRPDRDARRLRVGQGAHRLGDARHDAAVRRAVAERLAHDAARLPADRLVERRRRHRLPRRTSSPSPTCAARRSCSRRTRRRTSSCSTRSSPAAFSRAKSNTSSLRTRSRRRRRSTPTSPSRAS